MNRGIWMCLVVAALAMAWAGCGKKEEPTPPRAENAAARQPSPSVPAPPPEAPKPAQPTVAPSLPQPAVTQAQTTGVPQAVSQVQTQLTQALGKILAVAPSSASATSASPAAASTAAPPLSVAALGQDEITRGLKEALAKGVQHAVSELGRDGGYLNNLAVKIPMPQSLAQVEKALRAVKQDKLADEFVATMNHAAEKAAPEAATIFVDAITQMSVADARAILQGPDDAATQYFRKNSAAPLTEKMLPLVKKATEATGVTASYKKLIQTAGPAAQLFGKDTTDLDAYVTGKAQEGLFKMIAAQEKSIRQNPVARTTDLLKKVFGSSSSSIPK